MAVKVPWSLHEWPELPLPSKAEFLASRKRRFGGSNPELVSDPFLTYMVKTRTEPYWIRETYGWEFDVRSISNENDQTAIWSFKRIGQSVTLYGEVFRIYIGGEHDDSGDPDFLINNDVVVEGPDNEVWIYAYPRAVFPPTDFHSATLIGERCDDLPQTLNNGILIVGGLCYESDREFWKTPVYWLDLFTMEISEIKTIGDGPGWICEHRAALVAGGKVLLSGGKTIDHNGNFLENGQRFELDLWTWTWYRST